MKYIYFILYIPLFLNITSLQAQDPDRRVWFDKPCTSTEKTAWSGARNLVSAGDDIQNPDLEWENFSLPVGNGNIGANVFGSVATERITFNEKTLWRGGPGAVASAREYWDVNKESAHLLPEIREALVEGRCDEAWEVLSHNFDSTVPYPANDEKNFRFGSFTTAGEFKIRTGLDEGKVSGYVRELLLDSALVRVSFDAEGVRHNREYFISYPSNVLAASFKASKEGQQNIEITYIPNPLMDGKFLGDGRDGVVFRGRLQGNGMEFVMRMRVVTEGGKVSVDEGVLKVRGADSAVLLVTADTDYKANFNPSVNDRKAYVGVRPVKTTEGWMQKAGERGFEALKKEHIEDYRALFARVDFKLDGSGKCQEPTPQRLAAYRQGRKDPGLETLYYDFGRYLLIASSRPGNMPANLQGIWHNNVDGPWRVDYHNNINIQMNYWPACPTNLAECSEPLFDFIRTLVEPGKRTARAYFGAEGWTASISGNIFGFTSPLDSRDMSWNYCPMAGPWLATHIVQHFDFTADTTFLRENFEILKGAADFTVGMLWKTPEGHYSICPSTSPEHGPVDMGATFANAVAREVLAGAVRASEILSRGSENLAGNSSRAKVWAERLDSIAPYKTGRYGQLQEWYDDIDSPDDRHRHLNHLYGLYPGTSVSTLGTPELAEASRVVLEHRGDGATGWSMGWKLNLWARLQDGDRAYKLYGNLLREGTNDNLWDRHPPFQIDGNFGGVAGVTEMLVQSHAGCIDLLPALPSAWHTGHLTGVKAVGNFTVDIHWKDNVLDHALIRSGSGGTCTVRYGNRTQVIETGSGGTYTVRFE
ncbi:MAG: glycosyl hydrolase family 95 catalytic domain-containing protein [Candidatus Cryptobacteroides sp.]